MKKLLAAFVFFFMFFTLSPQPVFAVDLFQKWDACIDPQTKIATLRCLPIVFRNVVSGFLIFVGVVALFLIIYSGIKLVLSGGDPKQVEAARKIMNYAIIGAILVLSSFAIIYFIEFITQSEGCITNIDSIATGGCN